MNAIARRNVWGCAAGFSTSFSISPSVTRRSSSQTARAAERDADTICSMTEERIEVQRTIAAPAADIFAVLCDPQGHVAIDATGMLQDATGAPAQQVGDQ